MVLLIRAIFFDGWGFLVRIKQATQGYFNDYHKLGDREGKSWIGPKTLVKTEVCPFPFLSVYLYLLCLFLTNVGSPNSKPCTSLIWRGLG